MSIGRESGSLLKGKKDRKVPFLALLLVPLLLVIVLQGVLPLATVMGSGAIKTMAQNAATLDERMTVNQATVLQNAMVNQWSAIRNDSGYYDETLGQLLAERNLTMQDFLGDAEAQREYLLRVSQNLVSSVENDSTSGAFLVLSNRADTSQAAQYEGVFLRDSDPLANTASHSDMLFERGNIEISRAAGITLDNSWSPTFSFAGQGNRSADDFFYKPYLAACANTSTSMENLGYWASPFILEDHSMDGHKMITYSVPLICDGVVYGVVGSEISLEYLVNTFIPSSGSGSLESYALMARQEDGTYRCLFGTGSMYNAVSSGALNLTPAEESGLFEVEGYSQGRESIYATTASLHLYANNAPYDNTNVVLAGFATESSIYGTGGNLMDMLVAISLMCAAIGAVLVMLVARAIVRPLDSLMGSVRGGITGLRAFRRSGIREVDGLHDVIQDLTENELATEQRLAEEKERYRLAVESSTDALFLYRQQGDALEISNTDGYDGAYRVDEFAKTTLRNLLEPADQQTVLAFLRGEASSVDAEVLLHPHGVDAGVWYRMFAKDIPGCEPGKRRAIGYFRNIDESKRMRIEQELRQVRDEVTGFYRLKHGMQAMSKARRAQPCGMLVLVDIHHFDKIAEGFGLTFGDVLVEELSDMMRREFSPQGPRGAKDAEDPLAPLFTRAGSDEFLVWLPGSAEEECRARIVRLEEAFGQLVHRSALDLMLHSGVAQARSSDSLDVLVRRVRVAVAEAKCTGCSLVAWEAAQDSEASPKPFGEVVSFGHLHQASLSSLAMNLLDRRRSLVAGLDLLSCCLAKRLGVENVAITTCNDDYLSVAMRYLWHPVAGVESIDAVTHLDPVDYRRLVRLAERNAIVPISEMRTMVPVPKGASPLAEGVSFTMAENGKYSGSIYLTGVDIAQLDDEGTANALWEVGTIIQDRINQEQLDQSARAKSDFLARMSHEIRTPMNGIIGMTEIALEPGQTEERRIDCLNKVRSSSHYLLSLLNDILDMSKIESGKMELVLGAFDLQKLLDDLHPVLDARFAAKRQEFRTDVKLGHTCFMGDSLRISQVLINLLGNAIKYSPDETEVLLTVRELAFDAGAAEVLFSVKDQGCGVSKEDARRIFRKFEQVAGTDARQEGTGLGLAISNRLVHMMGGQIQLESEVGRGSTFSFKLRLPQTEAPDKAEQPAVAAGTFEGVRVLVAEDNELNREILTCMLENLGCKVDCAGDGQQALQAFQDSDEGYYQAILMDVMMPVMDGLAAAHAIRMLDRSDAGSVAIVAASANAFAEDVQRSLASGMDAHLSKPIEPDDLASTLAMVLRER